MSFQQNLIARLWRKDLTLWCDHDIAIEEVENQLGWLDAVAFMKHHVQDIENWVQVILQNPRYTHVLLLGMGGSSLAAQVFYQVFGVAKGYPDFSVLDSTAPQSIRGLSDNLDSTLFIVASKSGATIETVDLLEYYYARVASISSQPGDQFVAITDPGSPLADLALQRKFIKVFLNPANIGGRYSALSFFGLVPAALMGVNCQLLMARTEHFAEATLHARGGDAGVDTLRRLVEIMSMHASTHASHQTSNQAVFFMRVAIDPPFDAMGLWIEQLVAESLGKSGKGIVPLLLTHAENKPENKPENHAEQTLVQNSRLSDQETKKSAVKIVYGGGIPNACADHDHDHSTDQEKQVLRWRIKDRYQLGAEFLLWQLAVALAASNRAVNPFNQPDVERAKIKIRDFVLGSKSLVLKGKFQSKDFDLCYPAMPSNSSPDIALSRFLAKTKRCQYLAILAFLPTANSIAQALESLCRVLRAKLKLEVTYGFGPRYLHSTGQLHKGGPAVGSYLQIVDAEGDNIAIPGRDYGFKQLHHAQADGDFSVLHEQGRPIMRVALKPARLESLGKFVDELVAELP